MTVAGRGQCRDLKTIGPYEFRADLGSGGFSEVKLAFHRPSFTYFACKVIARDRLDSEELMQKLYHELCVMVHLRHPGIVRLVDLLKDDAFYYVFLDLCAEGDLFSYIVDHKTLTEVEAQTFLKQILHALAYMHTCDVVHRDLKPENILIDSARLLRIKIADFGLSGHIRENELTGTMSRSPCYVAPEVLSGSSYDARKSDLWSVGVILYTMAVGNIPWVKGPISQMFAQIRKADFKTPTYLSDQCRDLIRRFLTVDVEKRITIHEALSHPWLAHASVPPPAPTARIRDEVTIADIEGFLEMAVAKKVSFDGPKPEPPLKDRVVMQESVPVLERLPVLPEIPRSGTLPKRVKINLPALPSSRRRVAGDLRLRRMRAGRGLTTPTGSGVW
jgi:serine/threonine protein kinase